MGRSGPINVNVKYQVVDRICPDYAPNNPIGVGGHYMLGWHYFSDLVIVSQLPSFPFPYIVNRHVQDKLSYYLRGVTKF